MDSAISLGKLFGIQFKLHFSWFIIFILVTVFLVYPGYSHWLYWVIGITTSLLFFASVVAHELAHSLVGRANGIPIQSITLFIFGGVSQMTKEAARPGAELKMAVAGPLCSLVIGGLFSLVWLFVPNLPQPVALMILWLAAMNIAVLATFNLIPGFPLDGGRILRALLWRLTGNYARSTRIAARLGQGIGYLFILGGIAIILRHPFGLSWFDGIWIAFIGLFLLSVASASYRQIQRLEVAYRFTTSGVTPPDSPAVPPDTAN